MTDYRQLCIELFGTDNVDELRRIAGKGKPGRKKAIDEKTKEKLYEMQRRGKTTKQIAEELGVSRQTVSKYLNKAPEEYNYAYRLDFMFKQQICTEIYVDFIHEKVKIYNRTDNIIRRAFGVNENPTWKDFEDFLEDRCFPRTRGLKEYLLKEIDIDNYDPFYIAKYNKGRTAEDNQYINFTYLGSEIV